MDILEAFEIAVAVEGRGAVLFGDEMIDEASRKLALVTANKGKREGLSYRNAPEDVPIDERRVWRRENLSNPAAPSSWLAETTEEVVVS